MTKILFLCPHNAAKSVLAAVYTQALVQERGLTLEVATAGTEPDAQVASKVVEFFKGQGIVNLQKPRNVTREDIASATHIVSMGCDLKDLSLENEAVESWDIPAVSENLEVAYQHIQNNVNRLLDKIHT
jgi:arsenate reductase (thioredoxin)